jgi:hypothetical protein
VSCFAGEDGAVADEGDQACVCVCVCVCKCVLYEKVREKGKERELIN